MSSSVEHELEQTFAWAEMFTKWKQTQPVLNVLSPTSKQEYQHEHEKMLCRWLTTKPAPWQNKYRAFATDNFGDPSLLAALPDDDLYHYAQQLNENGTNGTNGNINQNQNGNNCDKKIQLLTLAADRGHMLSAVQLGEFYKSTKATKMAFKWFLVAADKGHARSQYYVANSYYQGDVVPKNVELFLIYHTRAAEQGDKDAQYNLGTEYLDTGKYDLAMKWLSLSAKQNDPEAQYQMGRLYQFGYGVPKDLDEALKWFLLAGSNGDSDAQYVLGVRYLKNNDFKTAVRWFELAGNQNCRHAQYQLALYYQNQVAMPEYQTIAFKWCERSAQQQLPVAQNLLGVWYNTGFGVVKDLDRARHWYLQAAKQNHSLAQYNIAVQYSKMGKDTEMMYWLNCAANQNCAEAECEIGQCFEFGRGVDRDLGVAKTWYSKSAMHGFALAKQKLSTLSTLT